MREAEAMHTAARRYCRERYGALWLMYTSTLVAMGVQRAWEKEEGLELVSRYRTLENILLEIERLALDMPEMLLQLSEIARTTVVENLKESAVNDERERLVGYLEKVEPETVEPLPYWRVLREDEAQHLWGTLDSRWPSAARTLFDERADVIQFHTDWFDADKEEILKRILQSWGIARVFELRWTVSWEVPLDELVPRFESENMFASGQEAYWMTEGADWMVYAYHENAIILAGEKLVRKFGAAVPRCRAFTYLGELSTEDKRGRW